MQTNELMSLVTHGEPELVFAIVAPVGTDLEFFEGRFRDLVQQFKYDVKVIKLSDIAKELDPQHFGVPLDESTPYSRINTLMTLGNTIRAKAGRGDVLALHAIARIAQSRQRDEKSKPMPQPRRVYLLRSLKHQAEVEAVRRIYGPGFFLIGVNSDKDERFSNLTTWKGIKEEDARRLLDRDENEEDAFGQKTRDTFALSDVFVSSNDYAKLSRFLDLVFGAPFETPTEEEYAMFLAYAASLRSAQMARQVGAVIVSAHGEVVAAGANEVPKYGGGQYWPTKDDARDHRRGSDSNDVAIDDAVAAIVRVVGEHASGINTDGLADRIKKGTPVGDLTEFGRVVHAEMEALLACARAGVSPLGGTLYCTTFPCHNCAKHIIAAGITKVVYVEPYPKSRALQHHDDAISFDDKAKDRVIFTPFVGVAPRRYFDLFSMRLGSGAPIVRKAKGKPQPWERKAALPRLRMSPFGYMEREELIVSLIQDEIAPILEKAVPSGPGVDQERPDGQAKQTGSE